MSAIAQRIWREPAAAIGFLTTVALAIVALLSGTDWTAGTIIGITAPLVSALGIRQFVTPTPNASDTGT